MKFMCTKYGWNAKRSVHFIDVFMGGIFLGHPVLPTKGCIEIIFPVTGASDLANEEQKLLSRLEIEVVRDSIRLFGRKGTPL